MAIFTINTDSYINQPPSQIGDNNLITQYGVSVVFTRNNFTTETLPQYIDPENDPAKNLRLVNISNISEGDLELNNVAVSLNQEIPFTDIDSNLLIYIPNNVNENEYSIDFSFEISDVGSSQYTGTGIMTVTVEAKENEPPSQVGHNSITLDYGESYVFTTADFTTGTTPQYQDPEGDPADKLKIIALPSDGELKLNNVTVVLNQIIDFSDINSGLLTFSPDLSVTTNNVETFHYQIADSGSGQFTT